MGFIKQIIVNRKLVLMSNIKKVLILGGTSSIAKEIINSLEQKQYSVELMTYRQKNKIYGDYRWEHLDLEDKGSVYRFIDLMSKDRYSKIIFLPGNSLGPTHKGYPYERLESFYNSFLLRYNVLIGEASKSLCDNGQIIFISSLAANRPIPDAHYSSVKAGVQAFVRSLSCSLKEDQIAFSISPGAIDSSIKEQIAKIIAEADKSYNGRVIEIGY